MLISAALAVPDVRAQAPEPDVPPGWYEAAEGRRMLVSPAPGGGYRRLNFDEADFGALGFGQEDDAFRSIPAEAGGPALRGPDGTHWTRLEEAPYELRPVAFSSADGVTLAGLFLVPRRPIGRGAVMLHGSGDSDRDNVWAYTFAHALAEAGVHVVFADKRGSGDSGGDWRTVGLDALSRDGVAGFDFLVNDTGLAPACTGWVGLSQGGWVAALAAVFSGRGGYVVGVSSAAVPVFDQIEFEVANTLREEGIRGDALSAAMDLLTAIRGHATGQTSWDEYWAIRERVGETDATPFSAAMPADPDDPRWGWWARVGPLDPVDVLARAGVPSLILYGAQDESDNVPVERSESRLRQLAKRPVVGSNVSWQVFPGLGHALIDASTGWVAADVLDRLVGFVREASCGA